MCLLVTELIDRRIEEISRKLCETNGEYALAKEKSRELFQNIQPILHHKGEMNLTVSDLLDFREYFEHEFTIAATMQQELYKHGYLDCIKLLTMLGVLA